MPPTHPRAAVKDLVLVGGGHSHVAVLKAFGLKPLDGVRLTLICRDIRTPYSGMLPGLVAGHYRLEEAHIDLRPLARFAGGRLYQAEALGLDPINRRVLCRDRPPVPYDVVALDIGSTPLATAVPGADGQVIPVKPIDRFYARWEALRQWVPARPGSTRIGVVGGGAGGVELLLAVQYRLRRQLREQGRGAESLEFDLLTETAEILPAHHRRVRAKLRRVLKERGVRVHTGHRVIRVEPGRVHCANGATLALDAILWVTQAGAPAWVAGSGLAVDEGGFIQVNDYLQSVSHPAVFASGDIAAMVHHPRPKAGVFAVRQGSPLAENLRRALGGRPLKPFIPQRQFLSLIGTGERYAVASRGRWALEGRLVWYWKDWIDRRFMDRYRRLPEPAR